MEGLNKDIQLKINFDESKEEENKKEAYEKEQMEAGEKFGIINYKELVKKEDGEWYMHGIEISKYNEIMSEKDNIDLYRIPIKHKDEEIIPKNPIEKIRPNNEGSIMIPFDPER